VVVAIDHTESTFADVGAFSSTLLHRATDQIFTIDEMARLSAADSDSFLSGLLDANNTGLIGYSMGGFGALNTLGAGYAPILRMLAGGDAIGPRLASNEALAPDPRIQAAVLFAPFGGDLEFVGAPGSSFFEDEALAQIEAPTLWIAGERDDVSVYPGIVRLFENSVNSDRYLLTYASALHNIAPNPPPPEADTVMQYQRYAEPAWDERRINNINQHFVTAFFDLHLKGDAEKARYLDVEMEDGHTFATASTIWPGFAPRNVLGLSMRHEEPSRK
jgi:predicted dienelactone hydrolase